MDISTLSLLLNNLSEYNLERSPLQFSESDLLLTGVSSLIQQATTGYEDLIRQILQTRYAGNISGFTKIKYANSITENA